MAKSPAHKWGQIIGDFLEFTFDKELSKFAKKHKLFLDQKGERKARKGKKVSWIDSFGNAHDLDFVLERNGTKEKIGAPVAFNFAPFMGVVLAGEFTQGAINQLKSLGFNVLYFSYEKIIKSFSKFGIDASFEENTTIKEFDSKISQWEKFEDKDKLSKYLLRTNKSEVSDFFDRLKKCVSRYIVSVQVIALHGNSKQVDSVKKAIEFVKTYDSVNNQNLPLLKYEITIKYNNGDKVEGIFKAKEETVAFLTSYSSPQIK